jgi:hypothetical protein
MGGLASRGWNKGAFDVRFGGKRRSLGLKNNF